MTTQERIYSKLNSINKVELKANRVELALVQDIIKDAEIAKGKISSLENLAARREKDYQEVLKIAKKVGVSLDSKITEAGKFFIELERKLK
tara:strand:+ start:393 stop:665 length:273 start_codon:yes stop_codon:yes gene_type:complete